MSKKTFFIVTLLLILIAGGLGWYFLMGTGTGTVTEETPTPSNENLFPFGNNTTSNGQDGFGSTNTSSTTVAEIGEINEVTGLPRLRQISTTPAAGIIAFDKASSTLIRYIERATGHIFETNSGNAQVSKISNVTMPKIYKALWASDGSQVIVRYLNGNDSIKTVSAKILPLENPEDAIEATPLPDNIADMTVFGTKIFYITKNSNGASGITANFDGSSKASVWSSSFGDWSSQWTSQTGITLYSRPSYQALGTSYLVNPTNGSYTNISSSVRGLEALANNDGTLALTSSYESNSIKTSLVNIKTGNVESLGISTLVDKCTWSKRSITVVYCAVPILPPLSNYPDEWYKGRVSFSDSLWKIDTVSGETKELVNPFFESSVSMDMIDLSLNQSETVLVFKNKKDQIVWRYELVD